MEKIILANEAWYALVFEAGRYKAGCRDFTRDEALAHWGAGLPQACLDADCDGVGCAANERRILFRGAILAFDESKAVAA